MHVLQGKQYKIRPLLNKTEASPPRSLPKGMLAKNPLNYARSSASFYFDGTQGNYAMGSWLEWEP